MENLNGDKDKTYYVPCYANSYNENIEIYYNDKPVFTAKCVINK